MLPTANSSARALTSAPVLTHPSRPTREAGGKVCRSHWAMVGVPATRSFMSWKGVPSNCSAAARK